MLKKRWLKDSAIQRSITSLHPQKQHYMDFSFPPFDYTPSSILFFCFILVASIQLLFVCLLHARLAFQPKRKIFTEPASDFIPITVIIAARNEEDNLFQNLPFILEQDYPTFEVLVVNHQSIDDTNHILRAYQEQYKHLKVVEIARNAHLINSKKLPITMGIKAAKYEHFVFTDADCKPQTNMWLKLMAGKFNGKKEIILGYGPYLKKTGFLNRMIRFDTSFIALNYFSFALAKIPYMGVGRNMAYSKKIFDENKGFKSHYSIQSGDDDLFIQEAARKSNVCIQLNPASFCYSDPEPTWEKWKMQKQRHLTTSPRYKVFHKLLLGIYPSSLLLMWITFFSLLFVQPFMLWVSILFVAVMLIKWSIQGLGLSKLSEKSLFWAFPFLDVLYALVIPYFYYSGDTSDKLWK